MKFTQNKIAYVLLFLIFILLSVFAILSESFYEGADNITHYNIAHFAFQDPGLFLHHWGKPFFTLFASSFAQFGIKGVFFFNILAGLATAYFAFRIAKLLGYSNPVMAILFVSFTPLYFMMHLTSLTEVFFSFVLVASVFLALKNKYVFSAILLSFLPFVRNEGFVIFPLFFLFFIACRRYKAVPFLLSGLLIYSIAGYFYYHDFLWLFHQNPYAGAGAIYGSGSLFHFVTESLYIFRKPLLVFFISGVLLLLFQTVSKQRKELKRTLIAEWLLIFLPFCVYFVFHSLLWWRGISSLGLTRVLAGVSPLLALIALKGFNFFDFILKKKIWIRVPFHLLVIAAVIYMPRLQYTFPIKMQPAEVCMNEASQWLSKSEFKTKKIYYFEPFFQLYLHLDPYDTLKSQWMFLGAGCSLNDIQQDGVLLYDTHFGPNEGRLPLDTLMNSKQFKLLRVFRPYQQVEIMGHNFEVYVFLKVPLDESIDNNTALKSIEKDAGNDYTKITGKFYNYEDLQGPQSCTSKHYSGKRSVQLFASSPYSLTYTMKFSDLCKDKIPLKVMANAFIYSDKKIENNPVSLVISMEHNGESYDYYSLNSEGENLKTREWNELKGVQLIDGVTSMDDVLKVYLWYRGNDTIFVDDLKIDIYEKKGE